MASLNKRILLLLMLLPGFVQAQKASEWYARGIGKEAAGVADSAIYFYTKAIEKDVRYLPAYSRRAGLYFDKKQYRESLADTRTLIRNHAATAKDFGRVGQIAEMSGLKDSAAFYYKEAIGASPTGQGGYYYYLQGRMLINYNQLKAGILLLKQAEENGYKDAALYWQMGSAYIRDQQMKLAINALSKAIELSPTNDTLYAERAYALMQSREYGGAMEDYRYFLSRHPEDIISLYGLGETYFSTNQYDSAISCFTKVAARNAAYYQTWYYLGLAAAAKENYAMAIEWFDKAIVQYPDRGDLYYNRGIAKGKLNAASDFCSDFRKAMDLGDAGGKKMWEAYCGK
jgi:tetratricopeptide (TPR) repeat protein